MVENFPQNARVPTPKFILLGEDDLDDQEFLSDTLRSIDDNFKFKSVENGRALIQFLAGLGDNDLPDLIILDYNLPLLNGAEILQILNESPRYAAIPKIVWSTSKSPACKADCLRMGASDYVVKPNDMSTLKEVATYMLSFCGSAIKP